MDKGDTFLMGIPGVKTKHLWVVLSDTNKHAGFGVIVNLTTNQERASGECPIAKNEHPWLSAPISWVCYGDAVLMTPAGWAHIQSGIAAKFIIPEHRASAVLVAKIIQGAKESAAKAANLSGRFRRDYLPYLE